jgi:hypothetical protein
VNVAFNYVVRGGQAVRKDTKTHRGRWRDDAYLFSNDPAHSRPWNPDWGTHQIAAAADAAGVELDIKGGRYYTASQLLANGFDLRNTQRTIRKWIWHRAETRIAAAALNPDHPSLAEIMRITRHYPPGNRLARSKSPTASRLIWSPCKEWHSVSSSNQQAATGPMPPISGGQD